MKAYGRITDALFKVLVLTSLKFGNLDGGTLFTVEKGLPTKSSSTFHSGNVPNLAYDGDTNGFYSASIRCICSANTDLQPWWMVDLLQSYQVVSVRVWNRLDNVFESRFRQISIGLSNDSSVWTNFNITLFYLCAYINGVETLTDADNPIDIDCFATGRYLTVQRNLTVGSDYYLNFCEIDIFALSMELPLVATEIKPTLSASPTSLLSTITIKRSEIDCVLECFNLPNCVSIIFDSSNFHCWLFKSPIIPRSFIGLIKDGSSVKFMTLMAPRG